MLAFGSPFLLLQPRPLPAASAVRVLAPFHRSPGFSCRQLPPPLCQSVDEKATFRDLPPTLKVQLAVILHEDFLKSVSFFKHIDARIIATLVLCLRSRIYLPFEIIIHQVTARQHPPFLYECTIALLRYCITAPPTALLHNCTTLLHYCVAAWLHD